MENKTQTIIIGTNLRREPDYYYLTDGTLIKTTEFKGTKAIFLYKTKVGDFIELQ